MRALRDPRVGYTLLACAAVAVFLASVVDPPAGTAAVVGPGPGPGLGPPLGIPLDKWVHAGTYAVLAGLLCHAARARTARAVLLAAVAVSLYGFGIELVQSGLPARTFDPVDALANAVGAGLAALVWWVVRASGSRRGPA